MKLLYLRSSVQDMSYYPNHSDRTDIRSEYIHELLSQSLYKYSENYTRLVDSFAIECRASFDKKNTRNYLLHIAQAVEAIEETYIPDAMDTIGFLGEGYKVALKSYILQNADTIDELRGGITQFSQAIDRIFEHAAWRNRHAARDAEKFQSL